MDIQKSLETLGLKDKEVAAYVALLKLVEANANQIAKEAKLERTTIYQTLKTLCDKGLAHKVVKGKRYFYAAEPVGALEQFVKSKITTLDGLLPLLAGISGSHSTKPVVKYYENLADINKVLSLRRGPKEKDVQDDWYIRADKSKDLLREVRYLDPKLTFNQPLITIYDHTVGIFSSEKELSALIIDSQEFSKAMKVLFDIAWATAKNN